MPDMSGTWFYPVRTDTSGRPVIVEVHDGDTFRLLLDAGCETGLWPWLRLKGCDAPELDTPDGPPARDYMHGLLTGAGSIRARLHGRSFARWVATVWVDGQDVAELMIAAALGMIAGAVLTDRYGVWLTRLATVGIVFSQCLAIAYAKFPYWLEYRDGAEENAALIVIAIVLFLLPHGVDWAARRRDA